MAKRVVLSLSFDELTSLCCAVQARLGCSIGELTELGRRENQALNDRLCGIWEQLEVGGADAVNDVQPMVDQVLH